MRRIGRYTPQLRRNIFRCRAVDREQRRAPAHSLIVVSFVFGLSHIGQGITGQIENMIDGLLLGVIFLATGCNLWAAIIANGITDTIDVLLLYLGKYPGV